MTRKEAQKILKIWMASGKSADGQRGYIEGWFDKDDVEAFRMAIKALEMQDLCAEMLESAKPVSCSEKPNDLISRQDAIDAIRKFKTYKHFKKDNMLLVDQAEVMTELMMLPSADRPTGEWVWSDEDASWKCGRCDCVFEEIDWKPNYNFCPNCGARMNKMRADNEYSQ